MLRQSWRAVALSGATLVMAFGCWGMFAKRDTAQGLPQVASHSQPAQQADPTAFTAEELQYLQRRFGVHGPQTPLAQLFTNGVDQLQPLRAQTLDRLDTLQPVILRECSRLNVNPMLVTAILFDEIQHSKPGEDLPFIAHSGLVKTHGPGQLGISELVHQNLLPENPSAEDIAWARELLLDPAANVRLLTGKMHRLKAQLGLPADAVLEASRSFFDAKAIATLSYLHNGKLDYPARVLRYMQDPALHQLVYGRKLRKDFWI